MSDIQAHQSSDHTAKLKQILADYLHSVENGAPLDRSALIAAHPDLANDLRAFFLNHDSIRRLAESLKAVADAPTLLGISEMVPSHAGMTVRYFGDYELLEEIARGGMGVVFKARQVNLNRIVALKMILAGQLANESDVKRFYAEAESAAKLDHPGIVPIFEIGQHDGQHYFSMAFVEGKSLAKYVADGPLPPREAAEIVRKVAEAVDYAHEKGIIHRDLKPANVLLDQAGQPRVTDFGLAKQLQGDSGLTGTGQILGTPSYMPPEQAAGKVDEVGPAADVYALGAILYCLLTGRPPFQAANPIDTLLQVLEQEPVPVRQLNAQVSRDLETIAHKCLQKERSRRYGSAREVASELHRFLNGEPIQARPVGPMERGGRWCRRNPVLACLSAALGLALLGLAVGGPLAAIREAGLRSIATQREGEARNHQRRADENGASLARSLYTSNVLLARRDYLDGEIRRALSWLELCPAEMRHWEWHYLNQLCHSDLRTLAEDAQGYRAVSVAPGGQRAATATWTDDVTVWDPETGKPLSAWRPEIMPDHGLNRLAISPDCQLVATGDSDGTITVWNAGQGFKLWAARTHLHPLPENWHNPVGALAFSPDSHTLASGGQDNLLKVWNAVTGQLLATCLGHTDYVIGASISPDGKLLISAGWDDSVRLWDVASGQPSRTLPFPHGERPGRTLAAVAISPDGRLVAAGNSQGDVRLWEAASGTELHTWRAHTGDPDRAVSGALDVAFNPASDRLVTAGSDRLIKVWDVGTAMLLQTFHGHDGDVNAVQFTIDARRLVSGSKDGTVKVWDAMAEPESCHLPRSKDVVYQAVRADGNTIVASRGRTVEFWDIPTASPQRSFDLKQDPDALVQSADGRMLGVQLPDKELEIWDVANERRQVTLPVRAVWAFRFLAVFAPDATRLATAAGNAEPVRLWDTTTGRKLLEFDAGHVNYLAFDPSGKILATAGGDGAAQLWSAETGAILQSLKGAGSCWNVTFSHNGRWLASAGANEGTRAAADIHVWDVNTGAERLTLHGHRQAVESLAFSLDDQRLASASQDDTIRLWHLDAGRELLSFPRPGSTPQLAFSADGTSFIALTSDDVIIRNATKVMLGGTTQRVSRP